MSGKSVGDKLRHELGELVPVTAFFFVAFNLLAWTRKLMLAQYGVEVSTFAAATVGALIVAKVVLIADHFRFVNRFPDKPLIYNVLWKTAIYFVASCGVRYAEHVIHFWRQSDSFAEANRKLAAEVVWPHMVGVQVWLGLLLLAYCTMRELVRAIGRERVLAMFFGDPRAAGVPGPGGADGEGNG